MKNFNRILIIFILNICCFNIYSQTDWINFNNYGKNGQLPNIINNDSNFVIDFFGANRFKSTINDTTYDILNFPGSSSKNIDIGFPEIPILSFYIEINVDTPSILINHIEYDLIQNIYLYPSQEIIVQIELNDSVSFVKNDSLYQLNCYYPNKVVDVSLPEICRGHRLARVVVYPIQFNPISRQLKVIKNIDFSIEGIASIESDKDNIVFDNFLANIVLNYEIKGTPDYNIDLLIITPDEFIDDLNQFVDWKKKAGFRTAVVTKTELTSPPNQYEWIADPTDDGIYEGIDDYIKHAYDNWGDFAPEYILIIGEAELFPTHYWYYYGAPNSVSYCGTDYYYSTMDLSNSGPAWIFDFPDIHIGRISIESSIELLNIINKIIDYEKYSNETIESWFNTVNFAAEMTDLTNSSNYPECTEYRYFVSTSEYISSYLEDNNYNINKIYTYKGDCQIDDLVLRNGNPVPNVTYYNDELDPTSASNAVINAMNQGCFIFGHRDHGLSRNMSSAPEFDGWEHPPFNQNHIADLTNQHMLPVMFSINCGTGWFDGGTDYDNLDPPGNGINEDCLGELLLNKEDDGIVGFIGASREGSSGYNDELYKGLYDAIWPDCNPYNTQDVSPLYRLGDIKTYGLFFMNNQYIEGNSAINYDPGVCPLSNAHSRRAFETFHVLGDPTLEIWTGVPQPLYAYVDYTQNTVTVYDDNDQIIPEAKVVLQHGTDYIVQMTDINGHVISSLLNNNYDVEVSALKHNYIPWYTTIITSSQTWNANDDIRGNIIVTNGSTLTFASDITIPKYARIIVDDGSTLKINNDVNIDMYRSEILINAGCSLILENNVTITSKKAICKIVVNGNVAIGSNASFLADENADIRLEINNTSLTSTINSATFQRGILQSNQNSLTLNNCNFNDGGGVTFSQGNLTASGCHFDGASLQATNGSTGKWVTITNQCQFSNAGFGVYLLSYPNFSIQHSTFSSNSTGIKIYQSGTGGGRQLLNNTITSNGTGVLVYNSLATLTSKNLVNKGNKIYNNYVGLQSYNNSQVSLTGYAGATSWNATQYIKDNTHYEVYATQGSFPVPFKNNAVIDEDNTEPMLYYTGLQSESLDVRYNYWGANIDPQNDFYPWQCYNWLPDWTPGGGGGGSGSGAESLYLAARENIEAEEYAVAKEGLEQIVDEYPETEFAKAAMKELYAIEEYTSDNYTALKEYFNENSVIQSDTSLTKLADFLANFCDIKLENWPTAIAWFEDVIQQPETFEDSIFAIIDLGYTYWLMENSPLKSTYTGTMQQYKFASQKDYEENRDYLLSLLPGDGLSETMKQSLSTLKTGELLQNVPNPFNGTTQIWFKLTEESNIRVTIFDYTGKEVSVINPGLLSPGNHSVEFNSANLPSGIYFYSLEVNGIKTDTKKMTLMK